MQIFRAKQRKPLLANFIDVGVVIGGIAHRHHHVHRIAKLLMHRPQRRDMLVTAIAGISHQDSQFALTNRVIRHGIQCRIHTGRKIEQFPANLRVLFSKIVEVATGSKNAAHARLRQTTQRIEKTELPAVGDFVEIRSPDMPAELGRFYPAA